jgi:hypothetical protein
MYPFIIIAPFSIGGARLTLEKGLTLWFSEGTGIEIGGYYSGGELWAEGAADPDSLITFTALNGQVGGWNGISFNNWSNYNESVSSLKHCVIEKGKDYNIYSDNTNQPLIDSCVIRESGRYGIQATNYATPVIKHSQIVNNTSNGIYIGWESNPVIGNVIGEGNDIFNNGQFDVYNNSSYDIGAAYNFWGTTDDALIQERIYDYNDNAGVGTVLYADVAPVSSGLLGHYISLQAKYANLPGTILDNVHVTATGLGQGYEFTSRTNKDGYSTFTMLPDQEYVLDYATARPWGGGNGTDALRVMQHFSAINLLAGIHLAAADVNASGSVNSTDALLIMQRFAHMTDSFAAGDWVFKTDLGDTLGIEAADLTDTIRGLCYGDVNGSYLPAAQLKSGSYPVGISQKREMTVTGNSADIPFYASDELQLGAMSLMIRYPSEILSIEDLKVNSPGGQALFSAENGLLLAAWFSLDPMQVNTEEPLFYLTVNIKDMDALQKDPLFMPGEYSELADGNAQVIRGIDLFYPALVLSSATGNAGPISDPAFGMEIWPNPFNNITNLRYTLPEACEVNLKIYNSLGMLVRVLKEGSREAGSHTDQWDATDQPSGIYYYILEVDTGDELLQQSGKLILKRQ